MPEYFTVSCQRSGKVFVDGDCQGENRTGDTLQVFRCQAGLHDVSLKCLTGMRCRIMTQRVMISGTNPILPLRIRFVCGADK